MALQWYPGHMTKARRELAGLMPSQDLVIEVIDARLPAASTNPVVGELRGDKPCIKVLSKSDLADAPITAEWLRYLEEGGGAGAHGESLFDGRPSGRRNGRSGRISSPGRRVRPRRRRDR